MQLRIRRGWSIAGLRLLFAALLASGLLLTGPVPMARAATLSVTTTADELSTNGQCSLREAIRAANTDTRIDTCAAGIGTDTLILPAGSYVLSIAGIGEDAGMTGDLDITGPLALSGAGVGQTIIDANSLDRVVDIVGTPTVSISNLTLRNGSGQQLSCEPQDLLFGGGLANHGTLTVTNTEITGNWTSSGCWDAMDGVGGGLHNTGTLTMINSTVSHNGAARGGGIENQGTMTITASTVRNNDVGSKWGGGGGGIYNNGTLLLHSTTVSNNSSATGNGGGVLNGGTLTIENSTISGNRTMDGSGLGAGDGGGIANAGSLIINSSTITANAVDPNELHAPKGGGISGSGVRMRNTILAGNINSSGGNDDCTGTLLSQGYNLIGSAAGCTISGDASGNQLGIDPRLGPLQDNGDPVFTHAVLPGSPAIDRGNPTAPGGGGTACAARDQRGGGRPFDGNANGLARCDIGAFELSGPPALDLLGTFETDDDRNGGPDGWSLNNLATRSSAAKRSGSYSLRLQASGNRDFTIWQAIYGLRPSTTFDVAGWVNIPPTTDAFTFQLAVAWKDQSGTVLRVDTVKTWSAQTGGWNQATKALVAPPGTDHAVMRLTTTSLAATIYVDDVRLQAR